MTDALTARISNFETLDIKGGGGITHDISGLTGLTSLKASAGLTGNITITDLAAAAEIDIMASLGSDLTINQINAVGGGSDNLAFDFSGVLTPLGVQLLPKISRQSRYRRAREESKQLVELLLRMQAP